MRNQFIIIALIAFAFVSCDKSQAPTQAPQSRASGFDKATSSWTTQSFDMWNPCCGEMVHFESKVHYVTDEKTDKDGITTRTIRINVAGTQAIGLSSGIKYAMQENDELVNIPPTGCPSSGSQQVKFRATGTGSGNGGNDCSFVYTNNFTYSLDNACNLTINSTGATIECE
jgi:hypothetical protein